MNQTDIIILDLIEFLRFEKKIKSEGDFVRRVGMIQPTLSKIKAGIAHFTVEHIKAICKEFNVNANFIYAIQTNVFNDENSIKIDRYISTEAVVK